MARPLITSGSNALLKHARKLRRRKRRDEEGRFLIEGFTPVFQALEHGAEIETLIVAPELLTAPRAADLMAMATEAGVSVAEVSSVAFGTISQRDNPYGVAAIGRAHDLRLRDLAVAGDSLFVALDAVGSPGNLGTIVRSVDAAGGSGVITIGDSTDVWHPSSVKASMGAVFSVPVCHVDLPADATSWCRDTGITIVTTSAHAATAHWETTYPSPALFLFGSEGSGLDHRTLDSGDLAVRIPMAGNATSLNLAVAVGILLYEARRP